MAACDVGLLPYLRNDWTRHIHPLKMYEYLACGLPVVATDLPAVHEEADVVAVAADAKAFIAAIAQALRDDNDALRQARRDRAAQNTWRQRVERISELIQETMDRKSHHARSDQTDRRMV
jgi:glycosyltransferase involved in cell wall biosynthesis